MGEIYIKYSALEDVINGAGKVEKYIDRYIEKIDDVIIKPTVNLKESDDSGYVQTATNLATKKINSLNSVKSRFSKFETNIQNVIDTARQADANVANNLESIASHYIKKRKWYQAVGDWIYNTFCVDMVNSFSLTRDFVDGLKWLGDKIGNAVESIQNWFKYGDGQYILNIAKSVLASAVAVVGTVAAICAIPFTSGATIPIVIGCIGAVATSVGTIITVVNSRRTIMKNKEALSISGSWLNDDDGNPGVARHYGSVTSVSEYWEQIDFGNASDNEAYARRGRRIDGIKVAADTTAFICSIASLGNKYDYRVKNVTTKQSKINTRYNGDKWYKGYSFTARNIKKNIMYEMGFKASSKGLRNNVSAGLNFFKNPGQSKYTLATKKFVWKAPDKLIKAFSAVEGTSNAVKFADGAKGLYDFTKNSDKDISSFLKAGENLTGMFKTSDVLSVGDKYLTKGIRIVGNIYSFQ